MSFAFSHPSNVMLLGRVFDAFNSNFIWQRKDRHILFVCGGPVKSFSRSFRNRFIKYSRKELKEFRVFLSESATKDLSYYSEEPEFLNIADFETLVAEIADSIIIFPESAGSFAELGFFTNNDDAIKKILVINDIRKQKDSFINIGLIDRINSISHLKPTILLDKGNPDFNQVKERLNSRLKTKNRKVYKYNGFKEISMKQRLYMIFQIVYIFRALSFRSIVYCLQDIFGEVSEKQIKHLLSILVAAGYLNRDAIYKDYFVPMVKVEPFLEFPDTVLNNLQAAATDFYMQYHSETYEILRRL